MVRLYEEGRILQVLRMSFREFVDNLVYKTGWRACNFYRRSTHPYWYEDHGVGYREKMSYRRRAHHEKKTDGSNRDAWREHKGIARDKAKLERRWGRKAWAKRHSNRIHRAWERRMIQKENWDEMLGDFTFWTHDPWMWD